MQLKFIILTPTTYNNISEKTIANFKNAVSDQYDDTTEIPIIYIESIHQILVRDTLYGTDPSEISALADSILTLQTAVGSETLTGGSIIANINALKTALGAASDTANDQGSIYARIADIVADINTLQTQASGDAADAMAEALLHTTVSTTSGSGIIVTPTAKTTSAGADYAIAADTSVMATKTYADDKASAAQSAAEATAASDAAQKVNAAKTELKGTSGDASSAETIAGAKKYADEKASAAQTAAVNAAQAKINELAGTNWTAAAGTVQDIIAELKADGSSVANLDTVVDKLRGDFTVGTGGSATTDVKSYIDDKFTTASGSAASAENNAKSYADGLVNNLDSDVADNYTAASGGNAAAPTSGHVGIKIVQTDGELASVDIVESDIASAATLSTVSGVADGAASAASAAQDDASAALNQLTWVIV